MNAAEALAVALIAETADGGCESCARELLRKLAATWPEHADFFTLRKEGFYERSQRTADFFRRKFGEYAYEED